MASRKPLVLGSSGRIEELQSADTLNAVVDEVDLSSATNNEGSTISKGQPVYLFGADSMKLGDADAYSTSDIVGLVADATIANGASGSYQTNGLLSLSDWTSVIGATNLTAGAVYFLSTTAGQLTTTPPSGSADCVVEIGKAWNTTDLLIDIKTPIKRA